MSLTRLRVERRVSAAVLVLIVLVVSAIGCGDDEVSTTPATLRGAGVSRPHLEGPVTGGKGAPFIASTTFDLAQVGYAEAEYFLSGTATAYRDAGLFADDGNWAVTPGDTAAYKTRIVVYRPIDARKFNGTVVVEWLNVSGGLDAAPDWITGHTALIHGGFAWVGVSAQFLGVEGGDSILGLPVMALKTTDPARYGTLTHPGDSFSYDIFSQAAQAIRRPAGMSPVGDLQVSAVIAAGESQSAFRLVTYIDAVHPRADIYDGFLVHSRGGGAAGIAPLSQSPQPAITVPGAARIRSDLNVPVLTFETETDLSFLQYFFARQPDSDRFRLWEVAGTAHADTYTVGVGSTDIGNSPDAAKLIITTTVAPGFTCTAPLNSGPQHFVLNAALVALNQWVRRGTLPPVAPRLEVNPAARIMRDAHGDALGGIRTPQVDVPIATLSGDGRGSVFCLLFGTTTPFDAATLASLYPDHDAYVAAFNAATDRAVQAGFILAPDAGLMKAAAAASDIGG
jgi:alpha/beta hydrolase family protein